MTLLKLLSVGVATSVTLTLSPAFAAQPPVKEAPRKPPTQPSTANDAERRPVAPKDPSNYSFGATQTGSFQVRDPAKPEPASK